MISTVDKTLQLAIQETLEEKVTTKIELLKFTSIAGGCINSGGRLTTNQGDYFLKWNDVKRYPDMFKKEVLGLSLLQKSKTVKVPTVLAVGASTEFQFLLLDFVDPGRPTNSFWNDLGIELAALHKGSTAMFGLDHDNYIGSLVQFNLQTESWIDFFIHSRLTPQLRLAIDSGQLERGDLKKFEKLYQQLPSLLPIEHPSLLHGDLWSGNVIVNPEGQAVLIDPAVYYGHREMEVAYTQLFGRFPMEFYKAYTEEFPLEKGFSNRVDIYNLYPLLVHVNLFGGSYATQVMAILNRFV